MFDTTLLTPLQRLALRAALAAPCHTLLRRPGGFGTLTPGAAVFTARTINTLELDGLLEFDTLQFPTQASLSDEGRAIAQQLQDERANPPKRRVSDAQDRAA